jgi:hypothetical protein
VAIGQIDAHPEGVERIRRWRVRRAVSNTPADRNGCMCRLLPGSRGLPRYGGGSASAYRLSRPAQIYPAKPLVSYRSKSTTLRVAPAATGREFITLLGSAAATWPIAAGAQQRLAMPVVGYLGIGSRESDAFRLNPIWNGLSETGYVESRNMAIEYAWAEGQIDRLPALAAELVRHQVSAIVVAGSTRSGRDRCGRRLSRTACLGV